MVRNNTSIFAAEHLAHLREVFGRHCRPILFSSSLRGFTSSGAGAWLGSGGSFAGPLCAACAIMIVRCAVSLMWVSRSVSRPEEASEGRRRTLVTAASRYSLASYYIVLMSSEGGWMHARTHKRGNHRTQCAPLTPI